jgi:hypothetical protein
LYLNWLFITIIRLARVGTKKSAREPFGEAERFFLPLSQEEE